MKSILTDDAEQDTNDKGKSKKILAYPVEFETMARKFVEKVREELNENEVRALAADKSACPVLVVRFFQAASSSLSQKRMLNRYWIPHSFCSKWNQCRATRTDQAL